MLASTFKAAVRPSRLSSSIGAVRTKVSLPDLDWDFGALEPHIS
ncbi:hypothetical protein OXX80_013121, partial [Metschnikowia pulcherrima]